MKNFSIDVTKIEASANKYTIVWKKAVTKNQKKLIDKIPDFILKEEKTFTLRLFIKMRLKFIL